MGELAALSAAALWAFASLLFTGLSRDHGPIVMNTLKCVIAVGLLILTLVILEGHPWPVGVGSADLAILGISGLVGLTIGDTAYFNALTRIGPRRALLMMALVPPTTALIAWPLLNEIVTLPMVAGMLLTVAGVVWVIRERTPEARQTAEAAGLAFALVAMVCQSTGNVLAKLGGTDASALGISVVRVLAGSVGLLVVLSVRRRLGELAAPLQRPAIRSRILLATFLGTYLGIWLINMGLKWTSHTGIAATLSSTSPIFILPLAWVVLGERFSARAVVGALIALLGVALLFLIG